jgi:hypothetical protein
MSLIHMALAFTLAHPVVTSPIIGPRIMEQLESQLGAVDVMLSDELLDRIDEIVPPASRSTKATTCRLALRSTRPRDAVDPARRRVGRRPVAHNRPASERVRTGSPHRASIGG